MANQKQWDFAKKIYLAAKGLEIHPLFTTAQAVLETGWGKYVIGEYNIFGVTKGSWTGPVEMVNTTEYFKHDRKTLTPPDQVVRKVKMGPSKWKYSCIRAFRKYESLEEAIKDHEDIFKKPMYNDAWPYKDNPLMFALKICDEHKAKYATSPEYYKNLRSLIIQLRTREEWFNEENKEV